MNTRDIKTQSLAEAACWVLIIVLLVAIFPVTTIDFKIDSTRYLNEAYQLYDQQTYTRTMRGPMMAVYGSVAFLLSGGDVFSVLPLPRIGYVVAVLAFAGLVRSLYGWTAAVPAALTLALMPIFHEISTHYHIDIFVVAASLMAVWALYVALTQHSPWLGALSGLLLTVAFLTKEVAVLLSPLWLVAWVLFPPYDKRLRWTILAGVVVAFVSVAPWALYVASLADAGDMIGRNVNRSGHYFSAFLHEISEQPIQFIMGLPGAIARFYHIYVLGTHPSKPGVEQVYFGVLIVLSQATVIIRLILIKSKQDTFAVLLFACFLPLVVYLDFVNLDMRQSAIIQAMAAVSLGAIVPTISAALQTVSPAQHSENHAAGSRATATIASVIFVVAIAATTPYVRNTFTDGPRTYAWFTDSQHRFEPRLMVSRTMLESGEWLRAHLGPGEQVLTTYRRDAHQLDAVLPGLEPVKMPTGRFNLKDWLMDVREHGRAHRSDSSEAASASPGGDSGDEPPAGARFRAFLPEQRVGNVLQLWLNRVSLGDACLRTDDLRRVSKHLCRIYYIDEYSMFAIIKKRNIKYVVTGKKFSTMLSYYDKSPSFERVAEFTGIVPYSSGETENVVIHQVKDLTPIRTFTPIVSANVPRALQIFQKERPGEFAIWRDEIMTRLLRLSPMEQQTMLNGETTCFEHQMSVTSVVSCAHAGPTVSSH